jgi:hypothetical protein
VELRLGSGVYIKTTDKDLLTASYKQNPLELMRKLLKNIIGERSLSSMGARGNGAYLPIPAVIYNTVHGND